MLKLIGIPVTAFIVCALIGPVLIPYLHKLKFGQSIRECGPASHMAKSGTPTMGGLMMLAALLVALLWGNFTPHVIIALVLTVGHAVIGFIDDYIKAEHLCPRVVIDVINAVHAEWERKNVR